MTRMVNISELADQVLASVRAETSTKTAAAQPTPRVYVPAARELRKLADDLRAAPAEDEVSEEDIAALMQDPEVQQLLAEIEQNPALLQSLLAGEEGGEAPPGGPGDMPSPDIMPSGAHPGMAPAEHTGMPPGAMGAPPPEPHPGADNAEPKKAPDLGAEKAAAEIRKIAAHLKTSDEHIKQRRLVKAAQLLNAATGLKHLTEGFK